MGARLKITLANPGVYEVPCSCGSVCLHRRNKTTYFYKIKQNTKDTLKIKGLSNEE